jgi:TPR repeat protein
VLFKLKSRKRITKKITVPILIEDLIEPPKLHVNFQNLQNTLEGMMSQNMPKLDPLVNTKVTFKEIEKNIPVQISDKKDIFIQAQEAFYGYGREQNFKEALEIYKIAEKRNKNVQASNCLGLMYLNGHGVAQDYLQAFQHFSISKDANDKDGLYWLGHMYHKGFVDGSKSEDNLRSAVALYKRAADQGQSEAMCELAILHQEGTLGRVDQAMAKAFYEKAVKLHNPKAMNNLGCQYLQDETGFAGNNKKMAFDLFTESKNLGFNKALTNLGIMHLKGIHVDKDLLNAKELFKKAARGDDPDPDAKYYLTFFKLKEASVSQDETRYEEVANELRLILAENPYHSDANYYLGFLLENGLGCDKDMRSAFKYYSKANEIDHYNSKAKFKLANMYFTGDGLSFPDKVRAFQLYKEAADMENADAQLSLG